MSAKSIQQRIDNGGTFDTFTPGQTFSTLSQVYRFTLIKNDSIEFRISVINAQTTPKYSITFYRFDNNKVKQFQKYNGYQWNYKFNIDLAKGDWFIEFETNAELQVKSIPTDFHYKAQFQFDLVHGSKFRASLTTKKRPIECHEELEYEIIDGEVPPGLKLFKTGLIRGIVENLDCINDGEGKYSPSFNWYYDNHDGTSQSWGRRWRFKVRVRIKSQPDVFADQWVCIRVYNNWNLDAAMFSEEDDTVYYARESKAEIPSIPELCPPCPREPDITMPKIDIQTVERFEQVECVPCADPTTPVKTETYPISRDLRIRTPDELIRYYLKYHNNFEPLVMALHNSVIMHEIIDNLGKENRFPSTVYEIKIADDSVTLYKYWLRENTSVNSVDAIMRAEKTITGQINPTDIVSYHGAHMRGVLTW